MVNFPLEKSPSQIFSKKLAYIRYIQLIIADLWNSWDVNHIGIKVSYLLQSYIVFLVAVWQESIIELIKRTNKKNNKLSKGKIENIISSFNTPDIKQINKSFKNAFLIDDITYVLTDDERKEINQIVNIRHKIVHSKNMNDKITSSNNWKYMNTLILSLRKLEKEIEKVYSN